MHSTTTCIGSGIKNLKKQQKKVNTNETPMKDESYKVKNKQP